MAISSFISTQNTGRLDSSQEENRIESLLPESLLPNSAPLISLLEKYYTWMNDDSKGPSNILKEGNQGRRDIDLIQRTDYFDQIKTEIGNTFPNVPNQIKEWMFKHFIDFYKIRGSQESIVQFFNILYGDIVEVIYPWDNVLIASDGNWNIASQTYLNNSGFLSDTRVLQDSNFYQKFSYVIRTGISLSVWESAFKRLIHPAGFKVFGEISIILSYLNGNVFPLNTRMKDNQLPAFILVADPTTNNVLLLINPPNNWRSVIALDWGKRLKFLDPTPISQYSNITITDLQGPTFPYIIGSYITI